MRSIFLGVCISCVLGTAGQTQQTFDVLIRHGRVLNGTGNPWLRADVGIRDDRIAALGLLATATASRVIDAGDRVVAPGFIDVHSHAAEGLSRQALRQGHPLLAQGITTIVANPDGGGPVDLAAQRARLEAGRIGPNVALLIGHGSVRREVMGGANRAPTEAELERMRGLVRRGMAEGAYGLSSGLFYTPGSFAKTEEVIALAAAAGERGGVYTSHIRDEANYDVGLIASVDEVIRIADEAKVIGVVSHMKALGPENWGLAIAAADRLDAARTRGVQVFADHILTMPRLPACAPRCCQVASSRPSRSCATTSRGVAARIRSRSRSTERTGRSRGRRSRRSPLLGRLHRKRRRWT
jgi:N-acyl-D-amino-acid deacylase